MSFLILDIEQYMVETQGKTRKSLRQVTFRKKSSPDSKADFSEKLVLGI